MIQPRTQGVCSWAGKMPGDFPQKIRNYVRGGTFASNHLQEVTLFILLSLKTLITIYRPDSNSIQIFVRANISSSNLASKTKGFVVGSLVNLFKTNERVSKLKPWNNCLQRKQPRSQGNVSLVKLQIFKVVISQFSILLSKLKVHSHFFPTSSDKKCGKRHFVRNHRWILVNFKTPNF